MNNFELVEKLVNTFGVSYETAKKALEISKWDLTDAAILIEREKNGIPMETKSEEAAEEKAKFSFDDVRTRCQNAETPQFFKKVWSFINENTMIVKKNSGDVFMDLPIWLAALLVCAFPVAMIFIVIALLLMGYHISFSGPQLNRKNVKKTVEKAEDILEDVVEEVKINIKGEKKEDAPSEPEPKSEDVKEKTEASIETDEVKVKEPVENSEETADSSSDPQE